MNKLVGIYIVKKVAAYHQNFMQCKGSGTNLRATDAVAGDRKVGVVWHTRSASSSMVFFSGQIITHPT